MSENLAAWENPPAPRVDLESSLHKASGFFNKLRTVNSSNAKELERDAAKLRLDKYPTELSESLGIAVSKLSKIVDIEAFVSLVGFLHRFLGPQFTTVAVPKILKSVEATGKVRTTLRVAFEFYLSGLVRDNAQVTSCLKLVLDTENSPPSATIKLLNGYRGNLKEFNPILEGYCIHLESILEPNHPKQQSSLLLSEELQRMNEQHRESMDSIRAYIKLCALIGRAADPRLKASVEEDERPGLDSNPQTQLPKLTDSQVPQPHPNSPQKYTPVSSRPGTPNSLKWSTYEQKLTTMNTHKLVTAAANALPSDPVFYKKTQVLLLEKPRAYSLPHYSLFLSLAPTLAERVVPEILKRVKDDQIYLKYTSELAKIGLVTPDETVDVLIRLTRPQLQHQHIYTFIEASGTVLLENKEIAARVAEFTDFLRKLPASTAVERQLIDGSISLLIPISKRPEQPQTTTPANIESFLKLLLYRDLEKKTLTKISKVMVKLNSREAVEMAPLFVDYGSIPKENMINVAQIILSVSTFIPRFGYRVLDIAVERFVLDLQGDERQSLVSQVTFLGSLQAVGMVPYALFKQLLNTILGVMRIQFRLKLVCILIAETDAREFNVQEIITILESYKTTVTIDSDFAPIYNNAILHLQRHEPANNAQPRDDESDDEPEEFAEDEIPLDDDDQNDFEGFDQELDDEEFEREFSEMCGDTKPPLNEVPSAKPLSINFANLKIAKH